MNIDPNGQRYEGYMRAEEILSERWTRMTYGERGWNRCLVGALHEVNLVSDASIVHDTVRASNPALLEIDHQLRWAPYYIFHKHILHSRLAIERWNDAPWRRQKRVVKLVHQLAEDHKVPWLVNERIQLQMKVARLTVEIDTLNKKIARLELENSSYFKGLMDTRQLRSDRMVLDALDRELDESARRLQAL